MPFNVNDETEENLDWSKLPKQLAYLSAPATKYGRLQFEDRILEFLECEITDEQLSELKELARRMEEDDEIIESWLDRYNIVQHREAALVEFTGCLLAHARDQGFDL